VFPLDERVSSISSFVMCGVLEKLCSFTRDVDGFQSFLLRKVGRFGVCDLWHTECTIVPTMKTQNTLVLNNDFERNMDLESISRRSLSNKNPNYHRSELSLGCIRMVHDERNIRKSVLWLDHSITFLYVR
jgi:hypothetical protein